MKAKKIHASVCLFLLLALGDSTLTKFNFEKTEYDEGFYFGKVVRSLNETYNCPSLVKTYNSVAGTEKLFATECFCRGYRDGKLKTRK